MPHTSGSSAAVPVAGTGARTAPVSARPRPRLDWVDAGRGVAIVLVVLYHATNWLIGAGLHVQYWAVINDMLATMRMPLFFTFSGMFAAKWLTASWSALWNTKIRVLAWVFLVWEVVSTTVTYGSLALQGREFGVLHEGLKLALSPFAPQLELWFLWALSLFFVVSKLAQRVDVRVQLVAAALVSAAVFSVDLEALPWTLNAGWTGALKYLVFFLSGIHLRAVLLRSATRPAPVLAAWFVAWAGLTTVTQLLDLRHVPGVFFLTCVLGVLAGIALSRALAGVRALRQIGANTLPIYLVHTPLIMILTTALVLAGGNRHLDAVAAVVPLLLTAVAVIAAVQIHRACVGTPARRLYEPPSDLLVRHP